MPHIAYIHYHLQNAIDWKFAPKNREHWALHIRAPTVAAAAASHHWNFICSASQTPVHRLPLPQSYTRYVFCIVVVEYQFGEGDVNGQTNSRTSTLNHTLPCNTRRLANALFGNHITFAISIFRFEVHANVISSEAGARQTERERERAEKMNIAHSFGANHFLLPSS